MFSTKKKPKESRSFELKLMYTFNKIAIGLFVVGVLYKVISYLI